MPKQKKYRVTVRYSFMLLAATQEEAESVARIESADDVDNKGAKITVTKIK